MENVVVVNAKEHEQIIKELLQSPEECKMKLVNKDLKMVDPFSPNLTLDQKEAILEECKVNPMYFYDRVLGIKASRMSWDVIRTLQSYPKEKPGDHDGGTLGDFVCEPGIQRTSRRTLGEDRRLPRMGELYRDMFLEPGQVAEEKPSFIDEWEKLAWTAWNLTLMHFAHSMNPGRASIEKRFYQEWEERAPEGVSARPIWEDNLYSKVTFEFKRGNGDWLTKLPTPPREPTPSVKVPQTFTIATMFGPMDPAELHKLAVVTWNIVVERNQGRFSVTEAMYEEQFQREVGLTVGSDRVKVEMRGGEPSFFYRRDGQWLPLQ